MTQDNALETLDADKALKQVSGDPDWMFKAGLGGVLTAGCFLTTALDAQHLLLLPVALAVNAVITGYLLRVVRQRVKKPDSKRLPEWDEWPDLFMSGITWTAIQFGINIIALTVISSAVILAVYAAITPHAYRVAIAETALAVTLLVVFWTHFLSTFLWVNFAVEERVSGGWAIRKVAMTIRKNASEFWIAWALSCALQFTAVLLPAITLVGVFLVPTTLFAAQILSALILAQVWETASD